MISTTTTTTTATAVTSHPPRRAPPKPTTIPPLDALLSSHFRATRSPHLAITSRPLPLLYALASRLLSTDKTLLIIDLESRFDPTRLECSARDLAHAHVLRPPRCLSGSEEVRGMVERAREWMVYGAGTGSRGAGVVGAP
ncbi:uncharacterized protein DNG_09822 [Cephalotrichum gorgonifer]|uniref:Uncharacterized protein n=1 Tax=Cephalotrichum gorgonifer TaxID=2041049 RepID=A0AAE8N857_9PEZI|nr:uncharacterized protein DNG_09822 [Cephalotrichum gorgonifer]